MRGGKRGGGGGDTTTAPPPSYTWSTRSYLPMGGKGAVLGNQWPRQDRATERSSTLELFKGYDTRSDRQRQKRKKCDDKDKPSPLLHHPLLEGHIYRTRLGNFGTRLSISMNNYDENGPKSRDGRQGFQEEFYSGCIWWGDGMSRQIGRAS